MSDLRIYQLVDTQDNYSPDIYVMVSDSTFSNDKKMPISAIYPLIDTLDEASDINPDTTELRVSVDTGIEERISVTDLLQSEDVIDLILSMVKETDWLDGIRTWTGIDANSFICNVKQSGKIVEITGQISMDSHPPKNETLITLPDSIKTASKNIYFISGDDASNDRNTEYYIPANTRTIKALTDDGGTDGNKQSYFAMYIADSYID